MYLCGTSGGEIIRETANSFLSLENRFVGLLLSIALRPRRRIEFITAIQGRKCLMHRCCQMPDCGDKILCMLQCIGITLYFLIEKQGKRIPRAAHWEESHAIPQPHLSALSERNDLYSIQPRSLGVPSQRGTCSTRKRPMSISG